MLPFVSEEYEAHLAIMMIWWWWWLIRERAYDSNIRKILKWFQKQSLWWEHRNILENCAITLCWGETSSKLCIVVKTELSLLCGLAPAKTSASWVNNSIRLHTLKRDIFLLRSLLSKKFQIISSHQNDALLDKNFVSRWLRLVGFSHSPRIPFFLSLQRQSRTSPALTAPSSSCSGGFSSEEHIEPGLGSTPCTSSPPPTRSQSCPPPTCWAVGSRWWWCMPAQPDPRPRVWWHRVLSLPHRTPPPHRAEVFAPTPWSATK